MYTCVQSLEASHGENLISSRLCETSKAWHSTVDGRSKDDPMSKMVRKSVEGKRKEMNVLYAKVQSPYLAIEMWSVENNRRIKS